MFQTHLNTLQDKLQQLKRLPKPSALLFQEEYYERIQYITNKIKDVKTYISYLTGEFEFPMSTDWNSYRVSCNFLLELTLKNIQIVQTDVNDILEKLADT